MWPWRSWMPAPWKCSCAVCSRGKDTARASAGSPSILTDVWTVEIKEFYFSGLILFTASSWTFLIEQGKLSDRVRRWESKSLCLLSHCPVVTCALLHTVGRYAAPRAGAGQHPGTWRWQDLSSRAVCHHGPPGKKNTSHHCGWFQKKVILFFKESVVNVIGDPPHNFFFFKFTIYLVQSFLFFFFNLVNGI